MRGVVIAALLCSTLAPARAAATPETGAHLVGTRAPGWGELRWLGARADWESLRGKVVLVRWWTQGCPYCEHSAPALKRFLEEYGARGLAVVGVYHPKPRPRAVTDAEVREAVREKGFTFPIAIDDDWKLLRRWWLGERERGWTSVSFLVDAQGVVRYVHPGGEYHREGEPHVATKDPAACVESYRQLKKTIEALLPAR